MARRTNDAPTRESRPRVRTPFIRRPPAPGPLAALHTCIHRLSKSRAHSPNADRPTRRPSRRWGDPLLPEGDDVNPLFRVLVHLPPAPRCPACPTLIHAGECPLEPARLGTPLPGGRGPQMPGRCHWQRREATSGTTSSNQPSFRWSSIYDRGVKKTKSRVSVVWRGSRCSATLAEQPAALCGWPRTWTYGTRLPVKRATV